jgi:hypothetical protein
LRPWVNAAWIFGLSRLTLLLFWYLSVTVVPLLTPPKDIGVKLCSHLSTNLQCFVLSWWNWDVIHYVQIAHDGYIILPNTAYFPLFPLLIHSVGYLFAGSAIADYVAALILANGCFYGTLVLCYILVAQDFGPTIAKYTLIYLAFAPYALFFFIGYTESLFLLLTLAIFLLLHRGKPSDWWLAGLCGFLAALTHPTGIVLIVPFMVLFMQKFIVHTDTIDLASDSAKLLTIQATNRHSSLPSIGTAWELLSRMCVCPLHIRSWDWNAISAILATALVPTGLLTYMLYLWITTGNPLMFTVQEGLIWHHYTALPWTGTLSALQEIVRQGPFYVSDISDVLFTLLPVVALIIGWKLLPLDYSLFSLVLMLFVLCEPRQQEPLLAVPRLLLVAFPIYILFAIWSQNRRTAWHLILFCLLFFVIHIVQYAIYSWAT